MGHQKQERKVSKTNSGSLSGSLNDYRRKRNFNRSPEPAGHEEQVHGPEKELRFYVQLHHASHIHYDFRIEAGGVLKSWAVPKGPSLSPQDQRLAVHVEDHPLSYGTFEGTIPPGNYGAGTVMLWDKGTYRERNFYSRTEGEAAVLRSLQDGHITLILKGHKLAGEFALVRLKSSKSWLLVKKRDEHASRVDILQEDRSVKTGRTLLEIKQGGRKNPSRAGSDLSIKQSASRTLKIPPLAMPSQELGAAPVLEKMPRKNRPMLPSAFRTAFSAPGWIFEMDYGGIRALAELEKGRVQLYSKQHLSLSKKFPFLITALRKISLTAILDGEIVVSATGKAIYRVKDLLHLEGINTRLLPLIERKKKLRALPIFNTEIVYCSHVVASGLKFYSKAKADHHPGILAKQALSPYRAGTSKTWLKILIPRTGQAAETPRFSHLDKIYWPDEKITKGNLIEYYRQMSAILLPHLRGKPESLHRHPGGITEQGFFQKNLIGHHPRWVATERIFSESVGKSIDYLICDNVSTLLYMANLGCIELNPWLSRRGSLDRPDAVVIDLDPANQDFYEVVEVARTAHEILTRIGATHFIKTSGASGLHIFIPVQARYSYQTGREFALAICATIQARHPEKTSLERTPSKRRGKIYLDCLQNVQGQTVASVYSVRPLPGAPVSTPLRWKELTSNLHPSQFTIANVPERVKKLGDLWQPVLEEAVDLSKCLSRLQ